MSASDKVAFTQYLSLMREAGYTDLVLRVVPKLPRKDKMFCYFFILIKYIVAQDTAEVEPPKELIDLCRRDMVNEFSPIPRKKYYAKVGREVREADKSLTDIVKVDDMKRLVENTVNWMGANGYHIPSSEKYNENLEKFGETQARDFAEEELEGIIRSGKLKK